MKAYSVHLRLRNGAQYYGVVTATSPWIAAKTLVQNFGYCKHDIDSVCVGGTFLNKLDMPADL